MTKKKDQLIDIFILHISMMADLLTKPNDLELDGKVSIAKLQESWAELIKFIDPSDKKVIETLVLSNLFDVLSVCV